MEAREDDRRGDAPADRERWRQIAASPEFARLEAARRRITVACLGLFAVVLGTFRCKRASPMG